MVWKLTQADLLQLKGGGGEQFAHFMDRLIRAEAACGGLVQGEIATQLRVNIKDGGVDTEVKKAIPHEKTGWFDVPTCWQFKAVEAKDVDDKDKKKNKKKKRNDLQEEIHKPYAEELIKKGYGYRFCILGDLAPAKLQNWESQLRVEAEAINPKAPAPRVIHGGHLLDWAERFPGVVAWLRNLTQGVFHWEAWAANRRAITPTYVPNSDWGDVRAQILNHVQFDYSCVGGEPCLFIGGAAGVGKTRLVFESLAELKQSSALVVVVEDEQEARRIATWLANAPEQFAIVVADECSPQARYFLNENLRGHVNRVRVISIDNTGEVLASVAGRVVLSPADALKNAEAILGANFSHVPEDRRRQYALISRGFIRLAADMCEHDAEMAAGDMSGVLGSVERYARHRLGKHFELISAIALFHKLGFREDAAGELELLCGLTGCPKQQFHNAVRAVRESPGFVVQAGRYWYVTPDIVARILFNEAWQHWVSNDLPGFLSQLPGEIQQQVLDRVATHAREEVREEVRRFFRGWFDELSARNLIDPRVTSLAAALVETAPDEYLPRLRSVIETAQPGELLEIKGHAYGVRWGPRRTLVWLLERLVSFPEYFDDCEACLFQLALEESEPQIGNNATAIWANLFSVYLSGTATPFDQRLTALRRRTTSRNLTEARLGFRGLAETLSQGDGHILGQPVVAGRLRPRDWQPATVGEERACYRAALSLCDQVMLDGSAEHRRLAVGTLISHLHFLLYGGMAPELRGILTPQRITEDESRQVLMVAGDFLEGETERKAGEASEQAAKYLQLVREWSNQFRPTGFGGKLRGVCARDPWDQRFSKDVTKERDETDELAAHILAEPASLSPHLDWLAGPEARSTERLGFAVGRADTYGACGQMIFEHAIAQNAAPFLRGYVRGMVLVGRQPGNDFLGLMDRLESAHPELAVDILSCAGDSFDGFNRILKLVDEQRVSPRFLAVLAMGLGHRELTAAEVSRLLPYFATGAASGDADTARAGLRFLANYLRFETRHSTCSCLDTSATRSLAWQLVEASLTLATRQTVHEWGEIIERLAVYDTDRAALLFGQALLAENVVVRNHAEECLQELAKANAESVMSAFGAALLDQDRGWHLQVAKCANLVAQLPPEVVIKWVRQHGLVGARAIARHLPPPHQDEAGNPIVPQVLDTILREYDDDEVFCSFLAGSHSGESWWGNGAEQFRHDAGIAKPFLQHSNPRIQQWAREEIDYRLRLADVEDREHEERFLPS